jgi:hypothetical protein
MSNVVKMSDLTELVEVMQNNDLHSGRSWMVAATNRKLAGDHSRVGAPVSALGKTAISIAGIVSWAKESVRTLAEVIVAMLEVGLSARRIYQDLVEQNSSASKLELLLKQASCPAKPLCLTSLTSAIRFYPRRHKTHG